MAGRRSILRAKSTARSELDVCRRSSASASPLKSNRASGPSPRSRVPGGDYEGYVQSHVRRLEALRRAGVAMQGGGIDWTQPGTWHLASACLQMGRTGATPSRLTLVQRPRFAAGGLDRAAPARRRLAMRERRFVSVALLRWRACRREERFAETARRRMRGPDGGYRRHHLRALAQRVEVAEGEVRVMGL